MVEVSKTESVLRQRRPIEQIGDAIVPNAILAQTTDNSATRGYLVQPWSNAASRRLSGGGLADRRR
jgi:hypothetical protein